MSTCKFYQGIPAGGDIKINPISKSGIRDKAQDALTERHDMSQRFWNVHNASIAIAC